MISIVGLGTGSLDNMTLKAYRLIHGCDKLFVRTKEFSTVKFLEYEGAVFKSYDEEYSKAKLFKDLYSFIADDIVNSHIDGESTVYAVPGHPMVAEKSVLNLIEKCKEKHIEYEIVSSTSFIDLAMEVLEIDASNGMKIIDAFDIKEYILNKREDLFITQVYNNLIASEVKVKVAETYGDEACVMYLKVDDKGEFVKREIKLFELDWQEDLDHTTYIYIKKDLKARYDIYDLIEIIDTLRSEDGCPWDKVQTHDSIKRELLEECYEVIDAIEKEDMYGLEEELGDLLLHVVFHSSIAKEQEDFNLDNVIEGICKKMIFRHPHIFSDSKLNSVDEVLESWEEVKKKEKGFETLTDEMNSIASALPGLIKAKKVQKKAAKVGFDFESVDEAMTKVIEELNEIKDVYKLDKLLRIEEEVGDLIFSVVNVGRLLDVDCEKALENTIKKFIKRFSFIEGSALVKGQKLTDLTVKQMNDFWDERKKIE